jgi:hypothetical protein
MEKVGGRSRIVHGLFTDVPFQEVAMVRLVQ